MNRNTMLLLASLLTMTGFCNGSKNEVKLMIASFGSIDSQAEVEGWLNDQLRPLQNLERTPALSAGDGIVNPELVEEAVYLNWKTKKLEYFKNSEAIARENARRAKILTNLKTHMLSSSATRYTQIARDYLQPRLQKHSGRLIGIVDRGNMSIQQTEKAISERDVSCAAADCVLSVVLGDREEDSKTIPVDNAGTVIKRTVYKQPYAGKIRDLDGNVILAFDGVAEVKSSQDNIVKSTSADPARKLIEAVCDKIAEEAAAYFTCVLNFKIKVPSGFDSDEVEISVDGRDVEDDSVRVLSCDHRIIAKLQGCRDIEKTVSADSEEKTVKLVFKK